jgi:hypothetical protein
MRTERTGCHRNQHPERTGEQHMLKKISLLCP